MQTVPLKAPPAQTAGIWYSVTRMAPLVADTTPAVPGT